EVRLRDGDRCQVRLDAGGVCGATWQVELDHVVPVALGGDTSAANLRCACRVHNMIAAERELGPAVVASARRRRRRGERGA
ncbi:MAG: HNH endonuclease, partial [Anaeromyxobacteraceae bacterium]|nr:HNH endonuclease [Anaeromyxobacteraceae bacterium]